MHRCSPFLAVSHSQLLLAQLLLKKLTPQLTKLLLKKSLAKVLHVKLLAKALAVKLLVKALLAKLPKLQANAFNAFQFGRGQHKLPPVVLYLAYWPQRIDPMSDAIVTVTLGSQR